MFDSPITTNDQSIDRVLAAGLPVVLVFLDGVASDDLKNKMERLTRENAGQVLVAKLQARENPQSVRRFQINRTPAVVGVLNGKMETRAEAISGRDLEGHIAFLLGRGPRPEAPKATPQETSTRPASRAGGAGRPQPVTDATFEQEVMRASLPVLVDFWAPWCGPCRMTDPILEKLAGEMGGRLKIAKLNVDENPQTSMQYDIRSIPTMMIVKGGQVVDRWMGALPEPALRSRIARSV
jgi:thioredoxin 1